jgi:hypothetical protein
VTSVDWEPKPSERVYYRAGLDGQRAYVVKRNGEECLRLDRPGEELIRALDNTWKPDSQTHPMTPHQAAKVAWAADKALCAAIGEFQESKNQWINAPERERIRFMEEGPDADNVRDRLFLAVMGCLKELTGG